MTWTNDKTARLTRLWIEGCSAGEIAIALGDVTRNSVIGKICRLKLNIAYPHGIGTKKGSRSRHTRQRLAPRPRMPTQKSLLALLPASPLPRPVHTGPLRAFKDLGPCDCKYAPLEPSDGFCGRPRFLTFPYCEEHVRLCYQLPAPKTRKPSQAPAETQTPAEAECS